MALKYLYVPSGYMAETAYGVLPNAANADFAFVRGSAATRVNADGLLESEATNVPRLDYTDGSCPTLLTEPASTNLLHNSGWEGGGALPTDWSYGNSDGTSTPVISTRGTIIKAYRFQTSSARHSFNRNTTSVSGTTYTLSVYVESVTGSSQFSHILYRVGGGGTDIFKKDGVVVSSTEGVVAGSFYSITFTSNTVQTIEFRVGLGVIGDVTGDVTISQPQLETVAYRTSFMISAVGAIATRSADTGVISGDLSSYLNSSEGVLEIKAKSIVNNPAQDLRITLSDGTVDNRISLVWGTGASTMTIVMDANGSDVFDGGTSGFKNLTGSFTKTNINTFKIKWKSGDIQVKHNDSTIVLSETDAFTMLGLDRLSFDNATGIRNFEGNVQYIKVYDSATDF
ncbi:hypothetical protein N9014_00180 [bacterium]|nr:hypothetical protein [bacterium]